MWLCVHEYIYLAVLIVVLSGVVEMQVVVRVRGEREAKTPHTCSIFIFSLSCSLIPCRKKKI